MITFFKRLFTEYILFFFIIIFSAQSANFLENKLFIILFFSYVTILFFRRYKKIDQPIRILIIIWFTINIVVYILFGNVPGVRLITFLSVTARLIYPYFVLKIVGIIFFDKIEKLLFVLSCISIPLFILQLIYPNLFYSLGPYLDRFTINEQREYGGWYVGIYMFNGWAANRNCGFMWEPGAFAFMVILGFIFRLSKNNLKIDFHSLIYIIAIVTTFSTMGYVVLFFILLSKFIHTKNVIVYIIITPLFFWLVYANIMQLDFMAPKIDKYYETMDEIGRSTASSGEILRVNRFGILSLEFKESLKWPFGFGIFEGLPFYIKYGERPIGPNTYAQILARWGWLGVFLFFISINKFIKITYSNENSLVKNLLLFALLLSVFSYSLLNDPLLLAILYFPYIFKSLSKRTVYLNKLKENTYNSDVKSEFYI